MDNHYIIKVNGISSSFLKGSGDDFITFLQDANLSLLSWSECFVEDLPFVYRREYRVLLNVRGVDWRTVNGKLKKALAIIGDKVDEYLEYQISRAIIDNLGESVFLDDSTVTILESNGEVREGFVEASPRSWVNGNHIIQQRKESPLSEFNKDDFWDDMQQCADLSRPE